MAKFALIYKGKGFLVGIPARSLTKSEADRYGMERLIASGLYAEPVTAKRKKPERAENETIIEAQPQADESEDNNGTRD